MTNNNLTDERLAKILSETQATITQHNSRQVRGSVEVDARLFEAVLMEAQLYRAGSNRLGIAAAAKWVDQQREVFDNEHGRHDPDTGAFEFGNDAQREYSSTLVDIAEGIRSLHPNSDENSSAIPDGYVLVPAKETLEMAVAGDHVYELCVEKDEYPTDAARRIWAAMVAAAPLQGDAPCTK